MRLTLQKCAIAVVVGCLWVKGLQAQARPRCAPSADSIAKSCELDTLPRRRDRNPMPFYPHTLRETGVQGMVHVQYVIDTTGRADPKSVRFLRSTHELFETAFRDNLPRSRWNIGRRQGVGVRAQVEEIIEFRGGDSILGRFWAIPPNHGVDSSGVLHTLIAAHVLYDSLESPRLTDEDLRKVWSSLTNFFLVVESKKPSAFCIRATGVQPPASLFERRTPTEPNIVPQSGCPRTYTQMVRRLDDPGPPPGWVDPVSIGMRALRPRARDLVILEVQSSQGTSMYEYSCQVRRGQRGWTADCRLIEARIS